MGCEGMRKNVLVKIGERVETHERIIPAVYDENGEIVTEETVEQYTVTVPIMESRNVDMTPEEIAEMEAQQAELPEPEPSPEERLAELEAQNQMLTQCLMEMSQIVYA